MCTQRAQLTSTEIAAQEALRCGCAQADDQLRTDAAHLCLEPELEGSVASGAEGCCQPFDESGLIGLGQACLGVGQHVPERRHLVR
jgi:hypothetical protein